MSTREAAGPARDLPPSRASALVRLTQREAPEAAPAAGPPQPADADADAEADADAAWSDAAVQQLHEGLLRHALQALHARGNTELKREILKWIFCPQPMVLTLRDAQGCARATVLPQDCTPFSFEQCCRVCGYSPERLRDGLAALLPAIGLAETLREITRASADAAQVHARANSETAAPAATIATPQTPLATPPGASA